MALVWETYYDSVQNGALKNLGFDSPPKASPIVRKGYFLRSVLKSFIDGYGSNRDPFGIPLDKGRVEALVKANHTVNVGTGALRALIASPRFPL